MLDARASADLLTHATSLGSLARLVGALGFDRPVSLDRELAAAVGIVRGEGDVAVASGPGALRALLVQSSGTTPTRELVDRLARRLAARAPGPLWLLAVSVPARRELVLAAWDAGHAPPRVRALTVDQRRVVESDAATLRAMHAAAPIAPAAAYEREAADVAAHGAWLEVLGRDALTRRFYRELARMVESLADTLLTPTRASAAERRDFALLQLSRLLFLSFVEARGWLDGDPAFLMHAFERCMRSGGGFHRRVLRPLVFGTLNTPPARRAVAARGFGRIPFLNGGLFARTELERRLGDARWGDEMMGSVFERLLGRYRFTAREDRQGWTDAAVDPEMLGRAFESLMNAGTRRATGAFYTPPALVAHATERALSSALRMRLAGDGAAAPDADTLLVEAVLGGAAPQGGDAERLLRAIRGLRVLDPACGSGAFLVHAMETLAELARRSGDGRPVATVRRELLASSIFGVDVNPMAVWLCELRLWLSVLIECEATDPLHVPPLPNLDHHVRVGDALSGGGMECAGRLEPEAARRLARLRGRYVRASGSRKRSLARALEREERLAAVTHLEGELGSLAGRRRDLLSAAPARDLFGERTRVSRAHRRQLELLRAEARRLRARRRAVMAGAGLPFAFATHFADVAAAAGFHLVLGNPPWVRPHRLAPADRRGLRSAFRVANAAAWTDGAQLAGAGAGFGGQVDMAALFVERGLTLLSPGGTLALLLPVKLWRSLSGGGVRSLLTRESWLVGVEDWSGSPHSFDAAVYPSLLLATRRGPSPTPTLAGTLQGAPLSGCDDDSHASVPAIVGMARHAARAHGHGVGAEQPPPVEIADWHGPRAQRWRCEPRSLSLDGGAGAPWVLLPPNARRAFDLLRERGMPLALGPAGRPLLGVKTGCNEAYLFRTHPDGALAPLGTEDPLLCRLAGQVEPALLRPLVRGEGLRPWRARPPEERILWPHDGTGGVLRALPPGASRWLAEWRGRLQRRTDVRSGGCWWSLFRTDSAANDVYRVAWADMGRAPRAICLAPGDPIVLLNTCYTLRAPGEEDALALTALLNAPAAAAWLAALAEPARGGYRRYMAWTLALLPLPPAWPRARSALAPLARSGMAGEPVEGAALDDALCWAFGLRPATLGPLLEWAAR